jgi:hypothetical protein
MKPVAFAAAILLALTCWDGAEACSFGRTYNPYANWLARMKPGDVGAAATIDWIRIEPAGAAACPRPPPYDPEARQREPEGETEISQACAATLGAAVSSDVPVYPFVAVVLESLKGRSPPRFVLASRDPWRAAGSWTYFSDPRTFSAERAYLLARTIKALADTRHQDPAFWDRGSVSPRLDLSGTCGGHPTLDPRMTYIAYRDAHGVVIGLEPVLYADDRLLQRLRLAREGEAPTEPLPLPDFFRSAEGLLLVEVRRCRWPRGRGWYEKTVDVRVLRGNPDDFPRFDQVKNKAGETQYGRVPGVDVDFIYDWALAHGRSCGEDRRLLLVKSPVRAAPAPQFDEAWALDVSPDLPERTRQFAAQNWQPDLITGPDRAARVAGNVVVLKDLDTGLRLDGPAQFSVDDAFSAFEQGEAERVERALARKAEGS